MIIKSLRENCPECPPGITFFENEIPILKLDLHEGHQRGDAEKSYIVRWRMKEEIPFITMQRYEEEVLTGYYTDALQEPSLIKKPHRVDAEYTYQIKSETGYRVKQLNFFLLFDDIMGSALNLWDTITHGVHGTFVSTNESVISFAEHTIGGEMNFILQMFSGTDAELHDFKEICFIVENRYFPQKVFAALLHETCGFPISQESAEEILRLAEAEQHAFFNPSA